MMVKKGLTLFLVLILTASVLWGCNTNGGDNGQDAEQDNGSQTELKLLPAEYPRVDGSTATIPLSEGFGAAVMELPPEEARQYILHNTTHNAYINLIEGQADIIFVTSPSEEELAYAEEKGVELEVVPIVSEGFVFLANKDNPVDSLTLSQIQDIYRGKITNWKEVGGADEVVVAYQRPDNSGSQTGMYDLILPKEELMEAPSTLKIQGMGGLVDAVAEYDNGAGAIGYSYYYYVTDMWENDNVKLLAVDGVYPDPATISDGSYPVQTAYYAVLLTSTPEESNARKLLSWILSEQGQQTAEEAGYVKLGK